MCVTSLNLAYCINIVCSYCMHATFQFAAYCCWPYRSRCQFGERHSGATMDQHIIYLYTGDVAMTVLYSLRLWPVPKFANSALRWPIKFGTLNILSQGLLPSVIWHTQETSNIVIPSMKGNVIKIVNWKLVARYVEKKEKKCYRNSYGEKMFIYRQEKCLFSFHQVILY